MKTMIIGIIGVVILIILFPMVLTATHDIQTNSRQTLPWPVPLTLMMLS